MTNKSLLIAGGGIAGLAAAIGLARSGQPSMVLEQSPVFEEVGAGVQLGPNAVKALKCLDAWDAVAPLAYSPGSIVIRDGMSGGVLRRIDLSDFERRFGEPYRVIHRADLLAGLLAVARARSSIDLRSGKRVASFEKAGEEIRIRTVSGKTFSGSALIGADGIRSTIRQQLLADGSPLSSGHILHRALAPIAGLSALADLDAVVLWLCSGCHVVHYPVSAGRSLNAVATVRGRLEEESWLSDSPASEVLESFANVDPALRSVLAAPSSWAKWPGLWRPPAPRWTRGKVVLIGDAAHPMLPFLAQGAAMALEDAAELAFGLSSGLAIEQSFALFERARLGRTAHAGRASQRQAAIYHASGPLRLARNAALKLMSSSQFATRLAWLYGWKPSRR